MIAQIKECFDRRGVENMAVSLAVGSRDDHQRIGDQIDDDGGLGAHDQDRGQHTDEGEIHGTVVTHIERETAADPAQQGQRDKNTDLMAGPWLRAEKEKAPCGRETDDEAEGADKNHIPLYDRTHRCLL